MQAVMETIFDIVYLIGVITLGILILCWAKGNKQFILFGIMAILLGCGDAFHLVPRMYALLSDGLENHAAAVGIGKLITSVTMTVFYIMLYHIWQIRYKAGGKLGLTVLIYVSAAVRIALCAFPQNEWVSADAPLSWGIYRNIPFVILGAVIIVLYFIKARLNQDKTFRFMWLAITLSFLFYIPVVLFADAVPIIGMLMIPKTCAYVWIVIMGYLSVKRQGTELLSDN